MVRETCVRRGKGGLKSRRPASGVLGLTRGERKGLDVSTYWGEKERTGLCDGRGNVRRRRKKKDWRPEKEKVEGLGGWYRTKDDYFRSRRSIANGQESRRGNQNIVHEGAVGWCQRNLSNDRNQGVKSAMRSVTGRGGPRGEKKNIPQMEGGAVLANKRLEWR